MTNGSSLDGPADSEFRSRTLRLVFNLLFRYITRNDGSPLTDALVLWRTDALQSPSKDLPSRAPSPSFSPPEFEDEPLSSSDERDEIRRSDSEPIEVSKKPTSSSWSRWWTRSRTSVDGELSSKSKRPEMRGSASDAVSLFETCVIKT